MGLTKNRIAISGKIEDLIRFDERFKQEHEVFYGHCSSQVPSDETMFAGALEVRCNWQKGHEPITVFLTGVQTMTGYSFSNIVPISKNDFLNGFSEWKMKHWGTDEDMQNTTVFLLDQVSSKYNRGVRDNIGSLFYMFDTHKGLCIPVVKEMSKIYPELVFVFDYASDDEEKGGRAVFAGGVEIFRMEAEGEDYDDFVISVLHNEGIAVCEHCNSYYYMNFIWYKKCPNCGNQL